VPLLIAGSLSSVAYWYWSELHGTGDLRPYLWCSSDRWARGADRGALSWPRHRLSRSPA
jgi:hypothetical protein